MICHLVYAMLVSLASFQATTPPEDTNAFPSISAGREFQEWIGENPKDVRDVIAAIVQDAQAKVKKLEVSRESTPANASSARKQLAQEIEATLAAEDQVQSQIEAAVDSKQLHRLRVAKINFEHQRLRRYCESMRIPSQIPDFAAVLTAAGAEVRKLNDVPLPDSWKSLEDSIRAFWLVHVNDLKAENDQSQTRAQLIVVSRGAADALRDAAVSLKVDLNAFQAAFVCERYPALCAEMPVDIAENAASNLVRDAAKPFLQQIYNDYLARRTALRAILTQAQIEWDQPEARDRRAKKFRELLAAHENQYKAWEHHPGEFAYRELYLLEVNTLESIRALVPADVIEKASLDQQFALTPLTSIN